MHIVFLADPVDTQKAGIHYYCVESLRAVLEQGGKHKITIIKPKNAGEFEAYTVAISGSPQSPWRRFQSVPGAVKKLNPDVVVEMAHMGPFNLPSHIKRVTVIHDLTPILFPKYHRYKSRKLQQLLLPRVLKQTDVIVTHSEHTKSDLLQHFPATKDKIYVIPLGKSEIFQPREDMSVLSKYALETPFFLSVGTIEPRKNYGVLLQAYQQFREASDQTIQLVIVGQKGWRSSSFYNQLKSHPFREDIRLLDGVEREDFPALYSQCQAFVFSSLYEGFGLPLLEAMSCGAYCISSNASSLPEVGGDAVQYFNPKDVKALEGLLHDSLSADKSTQKKKVLRRSAAFSWERYAEEFLELLNRN